MPPTLRLTTDAFGPAQAPIVFGWIAVAHQIGAAITAFAAGWARTVTGEYQVAFWASGSLCLVASMLALRIGLRRARRAPLVVPREGTL